MKPIWIEGKRKTKNSCYAFCIKAKDITGGDALKICALNIYSVYIDGKFTMFGPEKTAHGITAADVLDLSQYRKSELSIAIVVTGYNIPTLSVQNSEPFFSAEIRSADGTVKYTSDSFSAHEMTDRTRKINRFSYQRHFAEYYTMKADRRTFFCGDFSLFPKVDTEEVSACREVSRHTHCPTYEECISHFIKERRLGINPDAKPYSGRFLGDINPDFGFAYGTLEKDLPEETRTFVLTDDKPEANSKSFSVYDLGQNLSGFFRLKAKVSEKAKIYLVWDEVLVDGRINYYRMGTTNVIGYELCAGEYDIVSAEPYTGRYVGVIITEGKADVAEPSMILLENPDARRLKFECADKDYEKIINAARATFAQNCVDIPTDCPSRERAGWLCDSYFTSRAERLFTGMNTVEEHHLENYAESPYFDYFPHGIVPMCYPGDFPAERYIPNWAMWYIIEIADNIKRSGSRECAELSRKKVEGLLEFFKGYENEEGLLEKLDSWVFVEWSRANDFVQQINFPSNMLYCGTLRAAAEILGDKSLNEKADKLCETIRRFAIKDGFFADNANRGEGGSIEVTGNFTETCQYYAFYFGVATIERDPVLFNTMLNSFGAKRDDKTVYPSVYKSNAFVGNYLRLGFLSDCGLAAKATEECKDYFVYMADRTGTLWENDSICASCNHGFASYAANIVIKGLCGYVGADISAKKVIIGKTSLDTDCKVMIPIESDGYAVITVTDGKREICVPDGYGIVEV